MGVRSKFDKIKSIPKTSLIDFKAYVYYRKRSEIATRKTVQHFVEYGKIINEFYRIVGEKIVEDQDGVFIDFLGYFGVMCYESPPFRYDFAKKKNVLLDKYGFKIMFVPNKKHLLPWTADNNFASKVKQNLKNSIRKTNRRYNFNSELFKIDYNHKKYSK
jgi:hypothetical protein